MMPEFANISDVGCDQREKMCQIFYPQKSPRLVSYKKQKFSPLHPSSCPISLWVSCWLHFVCTYFWILPFRSSRDNFVVFGVVFFRGLIFVCIFFFYVHCKIKCFAECGIIRPQHVKHCLLGAKLVFDTLKHMTYI